MVYHNAGAEKTRTYSQRDEGGAKDEEDFLFDIDDCGAAE